MDVPDEFSYSKARAALFVHATQEREDEGGELGPLFVAKLARVARKAAESDPRHGETWSTWFKRYLPTKECGEEHRRITSTIEAKWIAPVLAAKPIATLTRDDIEDVRDEIDRAIDAKEIRHSTGRNAWGVLTGALKAAYASRDRGLRVLATPIHAGVLPPKKGASRQRPWLYPREWLAFASCKDIPISFRQVCAIALYTGLRPGELVALVWSDVDLEARTISVSKAWDAATKTVKPPKTVQGQRTIPIQENLLPLLRAMKNADGASKVLGSFNLSEDHMAKSFRAYLEIANVKRARLEADNATEERIDFRSLRDSHATWLALAHVPDKIIQRRLGHACGSTTDKYVKAAETFAADNVGAPFPALPSVLADCKSLGPMATARRALTSTRGGSVDASATELAVNSTACLASNPTRATDFPGVFGVPESTGAKLGTMTEPGDPLEAALLLAAQAGRFDVVAQLAKELEARRLASTNVVALDARRDPKR